MKKYVYFLFFIIVSSHIYSQSNEITLTKDNDGNHLMVDHQKFMINGMNWDYFPIGTNFTYSLWTQSDDLVKKALDNEMALLNNMGVNTIRVYAGMPPKWIKYIYENYGIYTVINYTFGRYGLTLDGTWAPNTDYSDPRVKKMLLKETEDMAKKYNGTPGLLMYLLGNENNYGLFWQGAETEDIPMENRKSTKNAKFLYQLFNDATLAVKKIDKSHPVAICNGDLLFLDIIAKECPDIDVLGLNVYRGTSFGDAFQKVKAAVDKPIMFTEFGADAFNEIEQKENQKDQADYLINNWKEIYENAAGFGKAGNSLGGFTFQFSDGWWKSGQTVDLDIHNTTASWSNGGYIKDYVKGENNMNEEWFGICAKGPTDNNGLYQLYPRAAYYVLKDIHHIKLNSSDESLVKLDDQFKNINSTSASLHARGDAAALEGNSSKLLRLSTFNANFTTFNTGGSLITTPKVADPTTPVYPNRLGFDHMESVYVGVEANPASNMRATAEFNIVAHVAENPIDQIFYENRARPVLVKTVDGTTNLNSEGRVALYRATYNWETKYFNLNGFYRTGHYHWEYEGDFFGLYPEANYGTNIDIYNGEAPLGFEFTGKKELNGLKIAFGPQLWWGANPAVLLKYSKKLGKYNLTGIYHEDLDKQQSTTSSYAIPQPKTRRITLAVDRTFGKLKIDLGGIWGGQPLNGRVFQAVRGDEGNYSIYQDVIKTKDNFGGKMKLTYTGGKFNMYAQGAAMGLVAFGGADYTQTFTGWHLKDSGSGNQYNFLSGFTYNIGNFQIAPNFLWQKPIEGPIPTTVPSPGRPRNILDDPFSVRVNRKMTAGELLLTYDPTPATWMYQWDNDRAEDAPFAFNVGVIYRHMPTTQDAAIGIFPDGRTTFAFPGGTPPANLWEVNGKVISKINSDFGVISNFYGGDAQANGSDQRKIMRLGGDLRTIYKKLKLVAGVKFNDWGPYDYHRDFNLTYPLQLVLDLSTTIGKPDWFILPGTQIGIRGTYRTLNQYSPRYNPTSAINGAGAFVPDPTAIGFPNGNEWEIRTYIQINIGK